MKLWTSRHNFITFDDAAAYAAVTSGHGHVGVYWEVESYQPRTHHRRFCIRLTGDGSVSRFRTNTGEYGGGDDYAATYDAWGYFLGYLFEMEPTMKTDRYKDKADFDLKTHGEYTR